MTLHHSFFGSASVRLRATLRLSLGLKKIMLHMGFDVFFIVYAFRQYDTVLYPDREIVDSISLYAETR
jgi:hypothetical protein